MHWMCRLSDGGFCLGLLENKFITPYANGSSKMHHFSSGANLAKAVPKIKWGSTSIVLNLCPPCDFVCTWQNKVGNLGITSLRITTKIIFYCLRMSNKCL